MSGLGGKWVVVTGVASGIGKATCQELLDQGANVIGIARRDLEALPWDGAAFHGYEADLADRESRARAAARIADENERIDAIVNNAGQASYQSPLAISSEDWARLFEVNVLAAADLTKALLPRLSPGGQVVNVSSVTSSGAQNPKFAAYGITKAALSRLSEAMRAELAPQGHRVTEITLGLVDTAIYGKVPGFQKMEARLRQAVPRWLDPEDVARAILWILRQPPHVAVGNITLLPAGQTQ